MGEPIRIVLTVEDEQALAKLQSFIGQANSGLNQLSGGGAAGFKQMAQGAKDAGAHIAGLSYYARSAGDSIRYALAGGGARAGFYAIDEAIRGLLASGMGLSTLAPILAVLAAAVGGGVLVWREWTSAEREAAKATKELHDTLKGTADLMTQMQTMKLAGLLSPEALQRNMDLLTGKRKLYKDQEGNVTESPTSTGKIYTYSHDFSYNPMPQVSMGTVANKPLQGTDLVKYLQDQLAVPGGNDAQSNDAAAKLKALRAEIHGQAISDTEAEIVKIHEKYQAERDEIDSTAAVMGKLLTPAQRDQNEKAKAESLANEQIEVARKREEAIEKINEENASAHAKFAAAANERLDKDLEESAVKQGKTREQIYQEEYDKRVALLLLLKTIGVLDEQQYTQAVQGATTKRIEGINRETEAEKRLAKIKEEMAKQEENSARHTKGNPLLTALGGGAENTQSQLNEVNRQIAAAQAALQKNTEQSFQPMDAQKQIELAEQRKDIEAQLNEMLREQADLQTKVDEERIQGVQNMFAKMGQAAKAFGAEGVAVYKGFAIAQATIDTAKAAIAAYSSVAGIPYVGPILGAAAAAAAIALGAAQISEIESASAREHGGPVKAGSPYIVGESGEELFVPASDGHIVNAADTARVMGFAGARSGGTSSTSRPQAPMHFNFFSDKNEITKHLRENPEAQHAIVDIARRNVHFIQSRA